MSSQVAPEEVGCVFGANVRSHRLRLGMTQEELAAKLNVHPPYISAIESGTRTCRLQNVVAFADALDTTAAALLKEPKKSA
jgi:transcriptional regulator with XRE-family HTH domain